MKRLLHARPLMQMQLLKMFVRRWWVVLIVMLLGAAVGLGYTFLQPPRYEARTTFVFKIGDVFKTGRGAMPALDALTRTSDVSSSVVRVATSRQTAELAASDTQASLDHVSIRANMLGNSTVLAIAVQGNDPTVTIKMANAVGERAAAYTRDAFKVYELVQLDAPLATRVQPNWLFVIIGGMGGFVLGIASVGVSMLRR